LPRSSANSYRRPSVSIKVSSWHRVADLEAGWSPGGEPGFVFRGECLNGDAMVVFSGGEDLPRLAGRTPP
jgi:hypothetical protein